jgi:hypothetical protein
MITKRQKQPKYPLRDEWISKMCYIQWNIIQPKKEESSDICYNMDADEHTVLSEVSQTQKDKHSKALLRGGISSSQVHRNRK